MSVELSPTGGFLEEDEEYIDLRTLRLTRRFEEVSAGDGSRRLRLRTDHHFRGAPGRRLDSLPGRVLRAAEMIQDIDGVEAPNMLGASIKEGPVVYPSNGNVSYKIPRKYRPQSLRVNLAHFVH